MKRINGLQGFLLITACLWLGVVGAYAIQMKEDAAQGKKALPLQDCGCTCSSSSSSSGEP